MNPALPQLLLRTAQARCVAADEETAAEQRCLSMLREECLELSRSAPSGDGIRIVEGRRRDEIEKTRSELVDLRAKRAALTREILKLESRVATVRGCVKLICRRWMNRNADSPSRVIAQAEAAHRRRQGLDGEIASAERRLREKENAFASARAAIAQASYRRCCLNKAMHEAEARSRRWFDQSVADMHSAIRDLPLPMLAAVLAGREPESIFPPGDLLRLRQLLRLRDVIEACLGSVGSTAEMPAPGSAEKEDQGDLAAWVRRSLVEETFRCSMALELEGTGYGEGAGRRQSIRFKDSAAVAVGCPRTAVRCSELGGIGRWLARQYELGRAAERRRQQIKVDEVKGEIAAITARHAGSQCP